MAPDRDPPPPNPPDRERGAKAFAAFDYLIRLVKVTLVVLAAVIAIIVVAGVDMAQLDEHPLLRFRFHAAAAAIVVWMLADWVYARYRRLLAEQHALDGTVAPPRGGGAAMALSLALLAGGTVAFWHDHHSNEIVDAVAVPAAFVDARCIERSRRSGPYMAIGYQFVSRSTRPLPAQTTCLLANCEPAAAAAPVLDTEYQRVPYASVEACREALPAVLAAKAPATVWTGDVDRNAAVRARFTPERGERPYFLLWIPALVAAVVLLASLWRRRG